MVLLVVDIQKAITNSRLYQFDVFESHVRELINKARYNNIEVIFVRHDDSVGNELTKGNNGFEIYEGKVRNIVSQCITRICERQEYKKYINNEKE